MAGPIESPNTLISNTRIKIVDVFSEGTVAGFWPISGVSGANPLCSVILDGVPIMQGDGYTNWNISGQGFSFNYTSGTSGQQPMPGFEKVEALIPLPLNTRVANPPPNNGYIKDVITTFNTTMYPDAEGLKVTIRFPAVYTVDTTNGNTNGYDMSWFVNIALNGEPFKASNVVGVHRLSDFAAAPKCTSAYLNTQVYTLPKPTIPGDSYEWKVRVRRLDKTVMSTNTQNDMFVDSMAVVSSNTYRYPMSALVGLEMSAEQFAGVPSRAYDVKGIKVLTPQGYTPTQYNTNGTITPAVYPAVWNGTFGERQWTDNPAWIFYDLVTNKRYGLGKYVRAEWVDKWTLYQIAQYCDEMVDDSYGDGGLEPRFTCNVAILDQQDAYTLLNNLVSVFQGMLYWGNGRVFPVGPEIRSPVFNFSNANVVGGAFNYTSTPRNTRSTVCIVRWNDPSNQFRPVPERVGDPTTVARFGEIVKDITAFATTTRGQALRATNWLLTVDQQLTETINFQTDLEGLYLRPGDVFAVYDNYRNNQQQGGRLLDFSTDRTYLHLDRPTMIEPGLTYFMSAIVPAATLMGSGDITGSSQINLIRNSQIETRLVTTAATAPATTQYITVSSGFSSGLYNGSVWLLDASGSSVSVFDQATQYKCISIGEVEQGKYEILGVEYQTGINITINTSYGPTNPPIVGDVTPPAPPTGLRVIPITGLEIDNTFFSYLLLDWTGSASANAAYYRLSGQVGAAAPTLLAASITNTGTTYVPSQYALHTFSVAAVNANGYESAYVRSGYTVGAVNPFGTSGSLSGVFIETNYDPLYIRPTDGRYTGYVGRSPTFGWHITLDDGDNEVATAQFITGYRIRLLKLDTESTILSSTDISVSGQSSNSFTLDPNYLFTGCTVKPLRGFTFSVDSVDEFGNVQSGGRLAVNNVQIFPPANSGFIGFNGGFNYNITPNSDVDVSGLYIWTNANPSFTPTYDNVNYQTTNLGGFYSSGTAYGNFYTWFALVDDYGYSGSLAANGDYNARIYGPLSGNTNGIFSTFGQHVSAQFNSLSTTTTGANASIRIMADAFVTGGSAFIGGSAKASWGFELNAAGKVVSMVATSTNVFGQPASFGTIVFGNADLQSDTYTAGSAGWKISANGNAEFNNVTVRGSLFYRSGTSQAVNVGALGGGVDGLFIGNAAAAGPSMAISRVVDVGVDTVGMNMRAPFAGYQVFTVAHERIGALDEYGVRQLMFNSVSGAADAISLDSRQSLISGKTLRAGATFEASNDHVDVKACNLRITNNFNNQTLRVDNQHGDIYISGTRVLRAQYQTPLVTLADVINCITYHGFGI